MASFDKRGGRHRARLRLAGRPYARTFSTLAEARAWARAVEAGLLDPEEGRRGSRGRSRQGPTLFEALARYRREVTPGKRGARQESHLIAALMRDPLAQRGLGGLTSPAIANWRNAMLAAGSAPATVHRRMSLVSQIFEIARAEWGVQISNPVKGVRRPSLPRGRERVVTPAEEALLLAAIRNPWVAAAAQLALFTAMRRSELLSLCWEDLQGRIAIVRETKNGSDRAVPLSRGALAVLDQLPGAREGRILPIGPGVLEGTWRRARAEVGLEDVRFHDLRHTAITRMVEGGLSVVEVMAISGHRSYRQMLRYTHLEVAPLAHKLDQLGERSDSPRIRFRPSTSLSTPAAEACYTREKNVPAQEQSTRRPWFAARFRRSPPPR